MAALLAEQNTATPALDELLRFVQTGSDEPRPFRRHRDVRIAHIRCSMLAEGGLVERDFPKRYKGKITEVLA